MPWIVEFHGDFEPEFMGFELAVQDALLAAASLLADFGPQPGRPYADTLKGSKYVNMKELRFEASNGEWRAAFAFDSQRQAILLVAGDKSGGSQRRFYKQLIAKADERFSSHLDRVKAGKKGNKMGRTLDQIIAELPPDRRERVEARYQELRREVEGLRELRQIAGKAQAEIASALNIKQPSVSKIEKQADMYLSTLRSYVEAVGGSLELTVKLPTHPAFTLHSLGDVVAGAALPSEARGRRRKRAAEPHENR